MVSKNLNRFFLCWCVCLALSANALAQEYKHTRKIKVHPSLPEYRLAYNYTDAIAVFRDSDSTPVQIIGNAAVGDYKKIEIDDYNFDGYQDVLIPLSSGSGGVWYRFWFFDPVQARFFATDSSLDGFASPSLDAATKTLHFHDRGGSGGWDYIATDFQFVDHKPVMIRKDIQEPPEYVDKEFLPKRIEWKNGEDGWVLTTLAMQPNGDANVTCQIWKKFNGHTSLQKCLLQGEWNICEAKGPTFAEHLVYSSKDFYFFTKVDGRTQSCDQGEDKEAYYCTGTSDRCHKIFRKRHITKKMDPL